MMDDYAEALNICMKPLNDILLEIATLLPLARPHNKIVLALDYLVANTTNNKTIPFELRLVSALFEWVDCMNDKFGELYQMEFVVQLSDDAKNNLVSWLESKDPKKVFHVLFDLLSLRYFGEDDADLRSKVRAELEIIFANGNYPLVPANIWWRYLENGEGYSKYQPEDRSALGLAFSMLRNNN